MSDQEFQVFQSPDDATVNHLVAALDRAYHRPGLLMWRSFLAGFMSALGATIGTLIILAVTGLVFHQLGGIALFSPLVQKLEQQIVDSQNQSQQQIVNQVIQQEQQTSR